MTGLMINLMIGVSVLMTGILKVRQLLFVVNGLNKTKGSAFINDSSR